MDYKLFVGVILYTCPRLRNDRFETTFFVASDHSEAEAKTKKYAIEYARKNKLKYGNFKVMVQAHHTNHVADCVHFVRTGFLENEVQKVEREIEFLM